MLTYKKLIITSYVHLETTEIEKEFPGINISYPGHISAMSIAVFLRDSMTNKTDNYVVRKSRDTF